MAQSSLQRATGRRPLLCYVTDRQLLAEDDFSSSRDSLLKKIEAAIHAGVDWVQIREKDLCARAVAGLVQKVVRATGPQGTKIFVNDRLDVALTENADGVHLGGESLPVREVRRFLNTSEYAASRENLFMVGRSCHSLAEAELAESDGADYIFFGPIFSTPSKIAFGEPQGLKKLEEVCKAVKIPVLVIGGITIENAGECLSLGASGIAAIRLFQDAIDLQAIVEKLRQFKL